MSILESACCRAARGDLRMRVYLQIREHLQHRWIACVAYARRAEHKAAGVPCAAMP